MSSPKMTKAAAFLSSISADEGGAPIPVLKPKQINDNDVGGNYGNSRKTSLSPTASPIKRSERPATSVQQMIKAKEQETKENRALDFTPRPDNKFVKDRKNVFITQNETNVESDKLSKSEINRMGVINNAMSNSPSKKNLNKLKDIQSRLENFSPISNNKDSPAATKASTLPKTFSTKNINKQLTTPSSIAIKNWLDTDRDNLKLAAFVCRMVEIKLWIEKLLEIDISLQNSDIDQFPDYLTNGILLAQIAQHFDPEHVKRVYKGPKSTNSNVDTLNYKMTTKQFKYIENIVQFLDFSRRVKLPSLFIFETNDLYEKKDIPKVIACLHALSCLMAMLGRSSPVEKLAEGEDVSKALLNLNVNVDTLKQIKHKVGRFGGTLGRKYVEGFDEAVRVNVGDDIRKLQLVQVPQIETIKENPTTEVPENDINDIPDRIDESETSLKLLDDLSTSEAPEKSLLSIDLDKTDLDLDLSDITEDNQDSISGRSVSASVTEPSSPQTPESLLILPPSAKEQEYTRDARLLFNKTSTIPSVPSVHSISEIQKKYQFLIDEDERELLGGLLSQSSYNNNDEIDNLNSIHEHSLFPTVPSTSSYYTKSSSPDDALVRLQSLARGYLLRFELFVTKAILKGNTSTVISFQSICRGMLARKTYKLKKKEEASFINCLPDVDNSELSSLNDYGSSEIMKTILKNKKRHGELVKNLSSLREQQSDIVNLQSSIRGMFMREKYWETRKFLLHEMNLVIKLQSLLRGNLVRKRIKNNTYFKKSPLGGKNNTVVMPPQKSVSIVESPTKRTRVRSKRIIHASDDDNPLIAPYDENELFEKFDIPATPRKTSFKELHQSSKRSPRKKPVYTLEENFEIPEPGKVPRRKETKRENAKYIPNLPIEEPLTPPRENKSISKLQHSPTKISLSEFVIPSETRTSSTNTVLFKDSKASRKTEDIITTEQMRELDSASDNVVELQSYIRGAMSRSRLNRFIDKIYNNEEIFSNFVAIGRGVLARKAYKELRKELTSFQNEIIIIQSILRGIESRVDYDCLIEDISDYSVCIIPLQSQIRGFLTRRRIKDRELWFQRPDNLAKICRLQAIIRGLHGVQDYKTLIEEKNPPVRAVKKFIGLLGGLEAEKTAQEELELIRLREEIKSEKNNVKEELNKLSKLKTKVEILRKNGIDIKNVEGGLRNNVNAGNAVLTKLVNVEDIIGDNGNFKYTVNNSSAIVNQRESDLLNECVGSFFFILQSKPEYWARVLNYIEMTGDLVEFSHGHIEDWILKCFNYHANDSSAIAEQTREECLYLKLILCTFNLYISRLTDEGFKEMIKRRRILESSEIKYWELLLHAYLNLPQQRTLTKTLLGDAVFLITSDDEVSFECDPMKIFKNLIETSTKITETQKINVDVGNIDPLDISCVETEYVKNMQNLRGSVYEIFRYLRKMTPKLPIFIRTLCREFYESMKMTKNVSEPYYLGMVGMVFIQCYVLPIFQSPANYSIDIFAISDDLAVVENIIRNIELVSVLLNQCVLMKHFDANKYPYLISLNPFIDELSGQMKDFINELIDVPLIDVSYRKIMLESSQESMNLKIQYDDIGELICIWKEFLNEIFGDHGDLLYYSIKEIEESLGTGNRKKDRKLPCDQYGFTIIKLVDDKDEGVEKIVGDAMMLEVKKYLIYILQVQDGKDLVDVLVSKIEPADELKFKELVKEEKKLLKNNYDSSIQIPERKSINQIHNSSFPQVKKHALELIFELERLGMISQSDGYQNLLNDIANDIRHKRKQQEGRDTEKAVIVETLTELKRRSRTYQKKYEEYEDSIRGVLNEHLMKSLQSEEDRPDEQDSNGKNSKAFLSKLFSRSGRKIKKRALVLHKGKTGSSGALYGQHKISLKHLMDKGVVRSVGETVDLMSSSSGFGGFTGSSKLNRVNAIFSCNKPGYFTVELNNNSDRGVFHVTLDELLTWQYEGKMDVEAFDGEVVFFSGGLLKFILGSFYSV